MSFLAEAERAAEDVFNDVLACAEPPPRLLYLRYWFEPAVGSRRALHHFDAAFVSCMRLVRSWSLDAGRLGRVHDNPRRVERYLRDLYEHICREPRRPTITINVRGLDAAAVGAAMHRWREAIEREIAGAMAQRLSLGVITAEEARAQFVQFDPDDVANGNSTAAGRAEALLRNNLSAVQLAQYDANKCFEVVGGESGNRYRIRRGRSFNVDELSDAGDVARKWCFAPRGALAIADVMLAQKIALESFEREALAVANSDDAHALVRSLMTREMNRLAPAVYGVDLARCELRPENIARLETLYGNTLLRGRPGAVIVDDGVTT